jgi:outer membrane protein assembly factor BamB
MPSESITPRALRGRPLRLLPAIAIAVVQLLIMFVGPVVAADAPLPIGMIGGLLGAVAIVIWWLFLSRAPWFERVGTIVLMVLAVFATKLVSHESMAGAGQGMLMYFLPIPYLALALVAWAVVTRHFAAGARRMALVAAILATCAPFVLMRTSGVRGAAGSEFHWRGTPTPEERLLARGGDEPPPPQPAVQAPELSKEPVESTRSAKPVDAKRGDLPVPPAPAASEKTAASAVGPEAPNRVAMSERDSTREPGVPRVEWPGFRGPNRDGVIRGVRINPDWSASPPVEVWRRSIGPGWSSFAVDGDLLYTQEQRGEDEIVSCYRVSTGEPVWRHRDRTRFWESNGGPGPRATPTLSQGRVYTLGATGILNALDARTGVVVWSHNIPAETKTPTPFWGFTASPLVIDDIVIAAASGTLAAYDLATGQVRWVNPSRGGSYSSPHRVTIDGVTQVLLLGGPGVMSVAPADGKLLWEHKWDGGSIVQPALIEGDDVLINAISMTGGTGMRRLGVEHGEGGWTVEERWTSSGLKPYFNDFVVHKGHAFGFDGSILACINLEDGVRKWKGGRFGNGQLVLLPDQDALLVLSEDGELAMVSATPDKFTELTRFRVFDAKTWNHPVLVGETLLVRNGEEMAAFRLSPADR